MSQMKKLSEELNWRGFVNQTTFDDITEIDKKPITFYLGVDPSAPSMTVGNLAAIMMVKHFISAGHNAVLLIGGATGLIGDPDGKAQERDLKTSEEVDANKKAIVSQYASLLEGSSFQVVDNYDWFKDIGYLEFLRDVGKHVPMRQMLNRDFVNKRLGEGGAGISYAEFSYVLIQAYDFVYLNKNHDVSLQLCGSDQWGNSIAGVDLIRRISGKESHVWSTPLVINKTTGKKFGKSEEGAVWLDPEQTSVYAFYQFWLNVDDDGVEDYLKIYTLLSADEITEVIELFKENPGQRAAQKRLAFEVTKIVHGEDKANEAVQVTEVLFGKGDFLELTFLEKEMVKQEFGSIQVNDDILQTLVDSKLASSKGEARNFIKGNGVSLNGHKISLGDTSFVKGMNLIKVGKNKFAVVEKK